MELTLEREHKETTIADIDEITGKNNRERANWLRRAQEDFFDTNIEYDSGFGMKKRKLSIMQGVSILNHWEDMSLRPTFARMGITEETINEVRAFVGKRGVALSEYLRERYGSIGQVVKERHNEVEGFPLDLVNNYGGKVIRANTGKEVEDESLLDYDPNTGRPTVKNGSFKARTENTQPIVFGDALNDFMWHMQEMHHYISHAEAAKRLTMTFGRDSAESQEMRRAIYTAHGPAYLKALDESIERIIRGGFSETKKMWSMLDEFRGNLTKGTLALKPDITVKQLVSAPAFIDEIGVKEYSKMYAEVIRNGLKWYPEIYRLNYTKNRLSNSQFSDIQDQINRRRSALKKFDYSDALMINVKAGDIGAIMMGGAPVYVYYYKKAKKEGKSDAEAREYAEIRFGAAADRAQQSSKESSKGFYLGSNNGGFGRTFFMYMTSPMQYLRIENVSFYNFYKALQAVHKNEPAKLKKVSKELASAFVFFHVLLPQLFQAVASGLTLFGDDDDVVERFWARQRKAFILGPALTFPVVGGIAEQITNYYTGLTDENFFGSSGSPMLDGVTNGGRKVVKFLTDPTPGAFFDVLQDVAQFKGIPLKQGVEQFEAIDDVMKGETDFPIQRLGGWSEWALGE